MADDNINRWSYDQTEVELMINDCIEREGKLTDWERGFMDNCSGLIDRDFILSKKQRMRLEEIWERVT